MIEYKFLKNEQKLGNVPKNIVFSDIINVDKLQEYLRARFDIEWEYIITVEFHSIYASDESDAADVFNTYFDDIGTNYMDYKPTGTWRI